jgi:multiple sugar transport system substrate-binding protein
VDVSEIGTTWIGNLIAMNALRPYAAPELSALGGPAAFLPSLWHSGTLIGDTRLWAVPWLADTRLIYFRRDLLKRAGVDPAAAFSSSSQLSHTLKGLRESGVDMPWVVPTRHALNILHNIASWVWNAGGDFVSADGKHVIFDQPGARAGIRAYFDLYRYLAPAARYLDRFQADQLFAQGQAAVTISGSWEALLSRRIHLETTGDWGLAIPAGVSFVGGSNLVIWQHARYEREAFKLVRFLTSQQAQMIYHPRIGFLSTRLDTLTASSFTDDASHRVMVQALRTGRSFPAIRLWGLIEDKLTATFTRLSAEILDQPAPDIDALLDKYLGPLAEQLNNTLSGK